MWKVKEQIQTFNQGGRDGHRGHAVHSFLENKPTEVSRYRDRSNRDGTAEDRQEDDILASYIASTYVQQGTQTRLRVTGSQFVIWANLLQSHVVTGLLVMC